MAQNVFSERFCEQASFTGGPLTVYTVPAGKVALIKTFGITWGDVTISGLDAWFQADSLTKFWRVTKAAVISDSTIGGSAVQFLSAVLVAGEDLQIQSNAGTADFFAAGYLLDLP